MDTKLVARAKLFLYAGIFSPIKQRRVERMGTDDPAQLKFDYQTLQDWSASSDWAGGKINSILKFDLRQLWLTVLCCVVGVSVPLVNILRWLALLLGFPIVSGRAKCDVYKRKAVRLSVFLFPGGSQNSGINLIMPSCHPATRLILSWSSWFNFTKFRIKTCEQF